MDHSTLWNRETQTPITHKCEKETHTHQLQNQRWHQWRPREALLTQWSRMSYGITDKLTETAQYIIWALRRDLLHELFAQFRQGWNPDFLLLTWAASRHFAACDKTRNFFYKLTIFKEFRVYLKLGYHLPTVINKNMKTATITPLPQ